MDLSKLTTADKLIAGGGIAYLIFMFLPWYGLDVPGGSVDNSGWDYFLGGILPLILILVMVAHVLISAFAPDTKLPDPPLPWGQVHLIAGVAAAVLVVLRLLIRSDDISGFDLDIDLDRQVGLFLAAVAAIVVAVGGFLKSQESGDARATGTGSTGSAPF
ncbi:MAG: hypothetical protein ABWZ76_11990 [Acidimicrobiales bacterium]